MDATYLKTKHEAAVPYAQYVRSGTAAQGDNWKAIYDQAVLTDKQRLLVGGFTRKMPVIAVSGIWCGDCVQQGPLIQRIAEANPDVIDLRWLDPDEHKDLQQHLRINAGNRVPVVVFCAGDYELVSWYGDRTLRRYRAMAQRQLGPNCPLPGAPVDQDELAQTLGDWLDQFERVHLLLRLSTRMRQQHGD